MKPRTEEFLYLLLWSCETLSRPTWRNLTEGFEGWAYRRGFFRQLAELERRKLVESQDSRGTDSRLVRLTASGRLHALGGRDPETAWARPWDGQWRLVLFDLPIERNSMRTRLRRSLKERGFGWLQNSVWITPHPVVLEAELIGGTSKDVESLLILDARPGGGETDAEIVAGAWDFDLIHRAYAEHARVLEHFPSVRADRDASAKALRRWASREREAWQLAVSLDPLLPECLLPSDYQGRAAWQRRIEVLGAASRQLVDLAI